MSATTTDLLWALLAGLAVGFIVGLVHFLGLRPTAALFAAGRPGRALALQVARFALVGLVFFALTRLGALVLVAGLGGLLIARGLVLRRIRAGEPPLPPATGSQGEARR